MTDKLIILLSVGLNMAVLVYAAHLYVGPQAAWYDVPLSYVTETWATLRSSF